MRASTAILMIAIPLASIAIAIFIAGFFRFLQRRRFRRGYDGMRDFAGSLDVGYGAIRERMRNGGPGWERKSQ